MVIFALAVLLILAFGPLLIASVTFVVMGRRRLPVPRTRNIRALLIIAISLWLPGLVSTVITFLTLSHNPWSTLSILCTFSAYIFAVTGAIQLRLRDTRGD